MIRGTREDMAAMASPTGVVTHGGPAGGTAYGPPQDSTLMEDPDIWRPN